MALQKLVLLGAVFLSAPAMCQDAGGSLRAELTGRYAAMKTAMASKDEHAIRSLLADGFVSVDVGGDSENATDMIGEVLALPRDPSRQSKTTIVSVTGDGRTAVVKQRFNMTKKVTAPDGTQKSAELSTLSTDEWVKDKGTWRIISTATKQLRYSVDGVILANRTSPKAH